MNAPLAPNSTETRWQRWLRSLLYGRDVDRNVKAKARLGLAIVAFAGIYCVIALRLVMFATVSDGHGGRRSVAQDAVATARPARGSADLIITAYRTGRTVTIVSNNSGAAITAYLADHRLTDYVRAVIGRDDHDPDLMKPSPYRVRAAVGLLDAEPSECALVGDSDTDVLAGRLAGVEIIGYATRPDKVDSLTHAGADAVTTELAEISTALRATPSAALPN